MEKFKDSDCLISVNESKENLCWICEKPINTKKPYVIWTRQIQVEDPANSIQVLDDDVILIVHPECVEKVSRHFGIIGDKADKLLENL